MTSTDAEIVVGLAEELSTQRALTEREWEAIRRTKDAFRRAAQG